MTLRADDCTKPAVKVLAAQDILDRLVDVHFVEASEERQHVDGAVRKAGVDLAVLVAREYA